MTLINLKAISISIVRSYSLYKRDDRKKKKLYFSNKKTDVDEFKATDFDTKNHLYQNPMHRAIKAEDDEKHCQNEAKCYQEEVE